MSSLFMRLPSFPNHPSLTVSIRMQVVQVLHSFCTHLSFWSSFSFSLKNLSGNLLYVYLLVGFGRLYDLVV